MIIIQKMFSVSGAIALAVMLSNTSVLGQSTSLQSYDDVGKSIASSILRQQGEMSFLWRGTAIKKRITGQSFYRGAYRVDSTRLYYSGSRGNRNLSPNELLRVKEDDLFQPHDTLQRILCDSFRYKYDYAGRSSTQARNYSYDASDRLTSAVINSKYVYDYNSIGKIARIATFGGTNQNILYSEIYKRYDAHGQLVSDSMIDIPSGIYSYTEQHFRSAHGPDSVIRIYPSGVAPRSMLVYHYDVNNRLDSYEHLVPARVPPYGPVPDYRMTFSYTPAGYLASVYSEAGSGGMLQFSYADTFRYTGSSPLYTYHARYNWNAFAGSVEGTALYTYTLNTAGDWDTAMVSGWDNAALSWSMQAKIHYSYNTEGLPVKAETFVYHPATNDYTQSANRTMYYYEDYTTLGNSIPAAQQEAVIIYPNPAISVLSVRTTGRSEARHVSIRDLAGRIVLQRKLSADLTEISIGFLPDGNYFVQVTNDFNQLLRVMQIQKR